MKTDAPAVTRQRPTSTARRTVGQAPSRSVLPDGALPLDNWLPYQFSYVANCVSTTLAQVYEKRFGLTVTGWRIIAVLGAHAPISAKELADRTGMDQVSITRAIERLVRQGMVSRRQDSSDRRRVTLRLSKKGAEVNATVTPVARAIETELLQPLRSTERDTLHRLMEMVTSRATVVLDPARDWDSELPIRKT